VNVLRSNLYGLLTTKDLEEFKIIFCIKAIKINSLKIEIQGFFNCRLLARFIFPFIRE